MLVPVTQRSDVILLYISKWSPWFVWLPSVTTPRYYIITDSLVNALLNSLPILWNSTGRIQIRSHAALTCDLTPGTGLGRIPHHWCHLNLTLTLLSCNGWCHLCSLIRLAYLPHSLLYPRACENANTQSTHRWILLKKYIHRLRRQLINSQQDCVE